MSHDNDNRPVAVTADGIRFLSVCSGIEAASAAWHPLGWQCIGVAEIEPFPAFILAHHYGAGRPKYMPDPGEPGIKVKDMRARKSALKAVSRLPVDSGLTNWGDFTKIDTATLGRVDVLAGGTPCQAFSVAGLRQSLADARGNLSLEFVRLAHELADRNGLRNAVWENVVGVLSTKDNAFGCFLAGLVGADSAIEPPRRGKWPGAGMVSGPKGRAAWRVLDAQYFGVAQRRRRVIVVADFGNGADPAAVLFEQDGLRRHSPPSREKGKDVAGTVDASAARSRGAGTNPGMIAGAVDVAPVAWSIMPQNSGRDYKARQVDVAQPIMAGGPVGGNQGGDYIQQYVPEIARCDATREGSSQDYETTTMVAVDVAPTMRAGGNRTGGDRPYGTDVDTGDSLAICIQGTQHPCIEIEMAHTLGRNSGQENAVIAFDTTQTTSRTNRSNPQSGDPCHPISASAHPPAVTVAIRGRDGSAIAELGGEVATALRASQDGGDKPHVLAFDTYNQTTAETAATVRSGGGPEGVPAILTSAVRRLTPIECERLQGFPDDYTAIPWRGKPADQCPDGPRYKALGNSWAVPKFVWLGERLQRLLAANDNQKRSDNDQLAA